ncbi:MAG: peptide deformylase [Clostridia bacterium]|nr:peptide deformylase [Clostridia bacterium]
MALRNIVKTGDPILSKTSRKVEKFDEKLAELIDDMKETMYFAQGVGLAAVQVGILKRVVIIDIGDGCVELVNPEIVSESKNRQCEVEGCLSLPGQSFYTDRPMEVMVKGQDRNGKWQVFKGVGLKARAFCHELDHLDGIVISDIAVKSPEENQ